MKGSSRASCSTCQVLSPIWLCLAPTPTRGRYRLVPAPGVFLACSYNSHGSKHKKHPLQPHTSLYNLLNFFVTAGITGVYCLCLGRNEVREKICERIPGWTDLPSHRSGKKKTSTRHLLEIPSVFLTLPDGVCLFGSNWEEGLGLLLPER